MFKIRKLLYLAFIMALLASGCTSRAPANSIPEQSASEATVTATQPPATQLAVPATPEPLPTLDPALQAGIDLCENVIAGQVCLVEGPVQVTPQPGREAEYFDQPGKVLNLDDFQTLKLGEAGSTKGLVMMRIMTEWPVGAFEVMAFGDVEITNEVPNGTREFKPMQSIKLVTGPNVEGEPPTSGFFVASPEGGSLSTLVVNGVELTFGSGAMLTGPQGGLTVQTLWGSVGAWTTGGIVQVTPGNKLELSGPMLQNNTPEGSPQPDPSYDDLMRRVDELLADADFLRNVDDLMADDEFLRAVDELMADDEFMRDVDELLSDDEFLRSIDELMKDPEFWRSREESVLKRYRELEEQRKKQKDWKGGWWKMTYGPIIVSGDCKEKIVASGMGDGGGDEPYTTEVPICKGNNGNTILMYESGTSYDRISPNLYTQSFITTYDLMGNGNITTKGQFMTLQVVSPTRMILTNNGSEAGGCTITSSIYLDYLRDDPAIRCGLVIYVEPWDTPETPEPTPEPMKVDPPVDGEYQAHISTLAKTCDPAAEPFVPNFSAASLSLTPEDKLVINAASTTYELALSTQTFRDETGPSDGWDYRQGIFSLQQPVDGAFGLTMTLYYMPGQQWNGIWLVLNEETGESCGGSIDLLPPE